MSSLKKSFGALGGATLLSLAAYKWGLPLPQASALFVILLMAFWWVLNALPYYVTATLPALSVPFLSFMGLKDAALLWNAYAQPIIGLFLGSFWIAKAVENHGLADYFQQRVLRWTKGSHQRLLLGFMILAAGFSTLLNNTSVAALILPITSRLPLPNENKWRLGLGIAWASSIGGVITLTGSAPNGIIAQLLEAQGHPISYLTWLKFGAPAGLGMLGLAYIVLRSPSGFVSLEANKSVRLTPSAHWTLIVLLCTIGGWLFLPLPSWNVALLGGVSLFILRAQGKPLLSFQEGRRIPWEVLWLFGGSLALAKLLELSGLSARLVEWAYPLLSHTSPCLFLWAAIGIPLWLTELLSNTALVALSAPLLLPLLQKVSLPPESLIFTGIATSAAFMLPVATPPNALACSIGGVPFEVMRRYGFWLNCLALGWIAGLACLLI
ncbi:MAG: SLC13 family permease [Bacteroidia bacterium]|nr:SLC13 family permease [Bacteroidia bacterium]